MALEPHETLFESGDASGAGIYIVVEGALGVFLAGADGGARQTNTLHPGESVGDLDVLDGGGSVAAAQAFALLSCRRAMRNLTCMAWEECAGGCTSRT